MLGVIGGVSLGSSPKRARCDGVNAMSVKLSFFFIRGERDVIILNIEIRLRMFKDVMM